jgi:hypothetical protein
MIIIQLIITLEVGISNHGHSLYIENFNGTTNGEKISIDIIYFNAHFDVQQKKCAHNLI